MNRVQLMKTHFILFRGIALLMVALNGAGTVRATEPFFEGLGSYSRKITTDSPRAQRYFNQGLAFLHGFNHGEAIRSFQEAARLDPKCAMAHWGIALACGPHINLTARAAAGRRAGVEGTAARAGKCGTRITGRARSDRGAQPSLCQSATAGSRAARSGLRRRHAQGLAKVSKRSGRRAHSSRKR